jgi:hypothetical protein
LLVYINDQSKLNGAEAFDLYGFGLGSGLKIPSSELFPSSCGLFVVFETFEAYCSFIAEKTVNISYDLSLACMLFKGESISSWYNFKGII